MDKRIVLKRLIEHRKDLSIDNYNEYTRSWSKGFIKGYDEAIRQISNMEDMKYDESNHE